MPFQVLANLRLQLVQRFVVTQALGEFVVDFRNFLLLNSVDGDLVLDGPSGQSLLRIIRPVLNCERLFLADLRSEKILRKLLQGGPPADFRHSLLSDDRWLFTAFNRAIEGNLGEVALLDRTVLLVNRNQFRHFLLKLLQGRVDIGILNL